MDERAIRGARLSTVDGDLVAGCIGNVEAMVNVVHRHSALVEGTGKGQARESGAVGAPRQTVKHIVAGVVGGRVQVSQFSVSANAHCTNWPGECS